MVKAQLKQAALIFDELSAPLYSTEWGVRASFCAVVLFSLLFCGTLIQAIETLDQDLSITRLPKQTIQHVSDNAARAISDLPKEHLFGNAVISAEDYVPITSLQLQLIGIVKSYPDTQSHVIISEKSSPGRVYSIGDSLPSGILVDAINVDSVILNNSGHLEKLPMQRSLLQFGERPNALNFSGEKNAS